jgi:hypothetical protein
MVPVRKVSDQFEARVIAARLGSEGIVTQLRGGGIEGPYPMGPIEILVAEADVETARELLLADEIESAFDEDEPGSAPAPSGMPRLVALLVLVCLLLTTLVRLLSYAS